jgi:Arc/MetJ-type ribon-helix-helix transcriptional regulator
MRVAVTLPDWLASALDAEVKKGRYGSIEEAVLTGARLVAGLGPRATQLLAEGAKADGLIPARHEGDEGRWE